MVSSKRYGYKVQLYHLKNGDITYYIRYGNKCKKVGRKSEGVTEKKCIELRNQILSEERHGIDLSQKSFKRLTFNELAEKYFESLELASQKRYKQMYQKHIAPFMGSAVIAELDDSYIDRLRNKKSKDRYSPATIKQFVSLCVRIANFGVKRGIIAYSPFRYIKPFKIDNARLRYLTKDEIAKLLEDVKDDTVLSIFVKIALETGARARSILALQKKHINFENKSLILKDFKRNNTYTGFLNEDTFSFIANHIESFDVNGYVVSLDGTPTKYSTIYQKLTKIFERFNKGLSRKDRANRVVIHTLRHTFASHLAIKGVSIQEIQKLMNHKDIKQTMRYAKLMPDSGRKFVENLYEELV